MSVSRNQTWSNYQNYSSEFTIQNSTIFSNGTLSSSDPDVRNMFGPTPNMMNGRFDPYMFGAFVFGKQSEFNKNPRASEPIVQNCAYKYDNPNMKEEIDAAQTAWVDYAVSEQADKWLLSWKLEEMIDGKGFTVIKVFKGVAEYDQFKDWSSGLPEYNDAKRGVNMTHESFIGLHSQIKLSSYLKVNHTFDAVPLLEIYGESIFGWYVKESLTPF